MKRTLGGFQKKPWLESVVVSSSPKKAKDTTKAKLHIGDQQSMQKLAKSLATTVWEQKSCKPMKSSVLIHSADGPIWCLVISEPKSESINEIPASYYAQARDRVGQCLAELTGYAGKTHLEIKVHGFKKHRDQIIGGACVGLELASYQYKNSESHQDKLPSSVFMEDTKSEILDHAWQGWGTNLARHLVNLPANILHPKSYAKMTEDLFKSQASVKINILTQKEILKNGLNLLANVGQAAEHTSRLIHLKYRPKQAKNKTKILVGKGITFDSGGLDVKPAQFMRLMKKDMGGSATAIGAFAQAVFSKTKLNIDCFLAVAENAVSANAFRPGDIITAGNGKTVEIDNTDAEGRLVLADALYYAQKTIKAKDRGPLFVFATLTGAMRVAVGLDFAGHFSSNDKTASKLWNSSVATQDLIWRLPLYQPYFRSLQSSFADFANSGSRYGGGITAALFLQQFIEKETDWSHFDFMAYQSSSKGALRGEGGNGQLVQLMSHYFRESVVS